MLANLNWTALIIGALVAYIIGGFWYNPKCLGKAWMQAQPHRKKEDFNKPMMVPLVVQAVATLFIAMLASALIAAYDVWQATLLLIVTFALGMWAGAMFLGQQNKLAIINIGNCIVTFVILALAHLIF